MGRGRGAAGEAALLSFTLAVYRLLFSFYVHQLICLRSISTFARPKSSAAFDPLTGRPVFLCYLGGASVPVST